MDYGLKRSIQKLQSKKILKKIVYDILYFYDILINMSKVRDYILENVDVIKDSTLSEMMSLIDSIDGTQYGEIKEIETMVARLEKNFGGLNKTVKDSIENLRYNLINYTLSNLKNVSGGEITNVDESQFVQRVVAFYLKMTSQPRQADLKLKYIRQACYAQLSANNPKDQYYQSKLDKRPFYRNGYTPGLANSFGHKLLANFDTVGIDRDLSKIINVIIINHLGIKETKLLNFHKNIPKQDVTYKHFISLMWLVITNFEYGLFEKRSLIGNSLEDKYGRVFTELVGKSRGLYNNKGGSSNSETRINIAFKMFQTPKKVLQNPALVFGYICNWIIIHLVRIHNIMLALNDVDDGERERKIFHDKGRISTILSSIKGRNITNIFSKDILNLFVRGGTKYPEGSVWDKIMNSQQYTTKNLFSNYEERLKNKSFSLRKFSRYIMSPGLHNVPGVPENNI